MNTAVLFGFPTPPMISAGQALGALGCGVVWADLPRVGVPAEPPAGVALAVLEFRPQETGAAPFRALSEPLGRWPVVVTGPDLPGPQVAQVLAGRPGHSYLRLNTSPAGRLEALRARLPPAGEPVLRVGPLRLHLLEGTVHCGARPVPVTATEFRLLSWLMRSPGEPIDSPTLAALADCHSVPTHLGNLRRKLGAHGAGGLLRGSPGQGYAVDARRQPRWVPDATFALTHHLRHLS